MPQTVKNCCGVVCQLTHTSKCCLHEDRRDACMGYKDGTGEVKVERHRFYCPSCRDRLWFSGNVDDNEEAPPLKKKNRKTRTKRLGHPRRPPAPNRKMCHRCGNWCAHWYQCCKSRLLNGKVLGEMCQPCSSRHRDEMSLRPSATQTPKDSDTGISLPVTIPKLPILNLSDVNDFDIPFDRHDEEAFDDDAPHDGLHDNRKEIVFLSEQKEPNKVAPLKSLDDSFHLGKIPSFKDWPSLLSTFTTDAKGTSLASFAGNNKEDRKDEDDNSSIPYGEWEIVSVDDESSVWTVDTFSFEKSYRDVLLNGDHQDHKAVNLQCQNKPCLPYSVQRKQKSHRASLTTWEDEVLLNDGIWEQLREDTKSMHGGKEKLKFKGQPTHRESYRYLDGRVEQGILARKHIKRHCQQLSSTK